MAGTSKCRAPQEKCKVALVSGLCLFGFACEAARPGSWLFGFLNEENAGTEIKGAFRAIECVFFKGIARIGSKLIQQVPLCGHLFYSFGMIHIFLPVPTREFATVYPQYGNATIRYRRRGACGCRVLHVLDLEFLLGAMEKHPQILPIDAELTADLVTIFLIEKDCFQNGAVSFRKAQENRANFFLDLPRGNDVEDVSTHCSRLRRACFIE